MNHSEDFEDGFMIRSIRSEDIPFITSTWLKSYYDQLTHWMGKIPSKHFYMKHNNLKILDKLKEDNVMVACNEQDQDQIFGYCVFEEMEDATVLHYMYIKPPYRKNGIRSVFMMKNFDEMSHYTPSGKVLGLVYNPYRW
jgi:hypothetical protein